MENKENDPKTKENRFKCPSCGANIKPEEKVCSYCGTPNENYQEKEIKDIAPPEYDPMPSGDLFGGGLGGFMGGVMLGELMRGAGFGGRPRRRR